MKLWLAMDADGEWYLYNKKPKQENAMWVGGFEVTAVPLGDKKPKSIEDFCGHWKCSLRKVKI